MLKEKDQDIKQKRAPLVEALILCGLVSFNVFVLLSWSLFLPVALSQWFF